MYCSIGSVIIDDIILADGQSHMSTLGGGGVHAVMGMRAWSDQVGLVAGVGDDFPAALETQLGQAFDLQGLLRRSHLPTPRAWQLFELDGHRSEIFRTSYKDFLAINPLPTEIPARLLKSQGVHLHASAPEPLRDWIRALQSAGSEFLLWEPWDVICNPGFYPLICELFQQVDCFSPNLEESIAITNLTDPVEIVSAFLRNGVRHVALRMGSAGSLVGQRSGSIWHVPTVQPGNLVDVTGAGNAYCGGLIVGMVETGDLQQAARYAAVSASFALEQFGAMIPLEGLHERARVRLAQCIPVEIGF